MLLRGIDSIDASPHSAQKLKVGLLFEASSAVAATTAGKGTGSDKQGHLSLCLNVSPHASHPKP